mmetsp:Transcript_22759/g.23695  ORF Transcript_22759/g.23695 Transcript_22759/m.23695 type:complete len:154 (+) Transcript_22759:41-502(+)|eukprot:CAMPEP_0170517668 /NCGR_PEP_ID=MMETSP0209-20121228/3580_1 /TAXON_ID=665100 ORGANISM="Litonotus pictus, Strain P1" /NCGR_SAMPLE_ID=MMETSP0209 /ASSEMBLY_ACC=CAM_ASM_000301 /LENGTH=153 /DNA_ID=CAMNT_0010802979 /DNA_START=23 /DNA_END=484 /DNA_ORIENTATION=+
MSKAIATRLKKELNNLTIQPICDSTVVLDGDNDIRNWVIILKGPPESPYSEGTFKIKFAFPDNYPFKPPEVKFITTVYHPNVKLDSGEICLDVFNSSWLPTQNTSEILEKIVSMLKSPSTGSPLEPDIANEFTNKYDDYVKNAKEYCLKYAKI